MIVPVHECSGYFEGTDTTLRCPNCSRNILIPRGIENGRIETWSTDKTQPYVIICDTCKRRYVAAFYADMKELKNDQVNLDVDSPVLPEATAADETEVHTTEITVSKGTTISVSTSPDHVSVEICTRSETEEETSEDDSGE